jgi:hypothetical protein
VTLQVEQPCPQCGGSVTLAADDRLLTCPYCKVKSFLFTNGGPFRYALPNRAKDQARLIYAPYLRFKGNVFSVTEAGVSYRVLDTTQEGCGHAGLPASLGLRPQAMKLVRIHSETKGRFLPLALAVRDIFRKAAKLHNLLQGHTQEQVYHQAYIGETVSFIYLPLLPREDGLFDAVLGEPLSSSADKLKKGLPFQANWQTNFLAALCPRCGGTLDGESDCLAPLCPNCDTAWQIGTKGLEQVACKTVSSDWGAALYLPFWKISARLPSLRIRSFADFIERTNQPLVPRPEWRQQAMQFWIPAFKLRPESFLRVSKQLTICQRHLQPEQQTQVKTLINPHPVTLPLSEALQSLKVVLAACAASGRAIFSQLSGAASETLAVSLVFLPFDDRLHDWTQAQTGAVINKSVLHFGRTL